MRTFSAASRPSGVRRYSIPYVDLPPAEYTAALEAAGVPAPWPQALPALNVEAGKGALFHEGRELSNLIGRPTTPLKGAVAAALA